MKSIRNSKAQDAFDAFMEQFKPIKNDINPSGSFDDCVFETYGAELEKVDAAPVENVWTLMDYGTVQFIVSGKWLVNRIGYFITEKPCEVAAGEMEFIIQ